MNEIIIDVREKDEFEAIHIEDSINLPLSELSIKAKDIFNKLSGSRVVLMCRSGRRAYMAQEKLKSLGIIASADLQVYPGGILEWQKQGKAVQFKRKFHLPVMRQVHLIAGSFILLGILLSLLYSPHFLILSALVGGGLLMAGATGTCLMAETLMKMPWNKVDPCGVSHDKKCCN